MAGAGRLPLWVWLLPLSSAVAAVVAWTAYCDTETGTWLGGALIALAGLLVCSLALEVQPHRAGLGNAVRRAAISIGLGLAAAGAAFLAAGLGYYLTCPPFG